MAVHHQTHLAHAAPQGLYTAGFPAAMQFDRCPGPDDACSDPPGAPRRSGAMGYPSPTVYGSFYKTLPADYSAPPVPRRPYAGYSDDDAVVDFSQKAVKLEAASPPPSSLSLPRSSPGHAERSASPRDHAPAHHTTEGGEGTVQLDSEGSSFKSSASDAGSHTSEGPPAVRAMDSPTTPEISRTESPLSMSDSSDIDPGTQLAGDEYTTGSQQPLNGQLRDDVAAVEAVGEHGQQNEMPEHDIGSQSNSREVSPGPWSPSSAENAPSSPNAENTAGSAKKQRLSSPNLNKIEAVINNLRTAKAKKRERKEPVCLNASPVVGSGPAVMTPQYSQSDPRSMWAMYALSQYAMMAPGTTSGGYYPYRSADTGAFPYHLQVQQALMAQHGITGKPHAAPTATVITTSPKSKKRKQPTPDSQSEKHHSYPSTPTDLSSPIYRQPTNDMKSEPLDFSRAASQSPPQAEKSTVTYSPSQRLERTRSPATTSKNRLTRESVMRDHSALWQDLNDKAGSVQGVRTLLESYQRSVDEFETARYEALLDNISSNQCKDAVHAYYNQERHALVQRIRQKLSVAQKQMEAAAAQSLVGMSHGMGLGHTPPSSSFNHTISSPAPGMATPTMGVYPYANALYGIASNLPNTNPVTSSPIAPATVPNFGAYSPMAFYMATAMEDDAAVMYGQNPEDPDNGGKRKFLTAEAVSRLQSWYDLNAEHPYPDEDDVEELAREAMVSPVQVKKWMANKRVRSSNTLAFNGSIHPKKIQKLIQLKELAEKSGTSYYPSQDPGPALPIQSSAVSPNLLLKQRANASSASAKKNKRLLDPSAVAYMTQWYHDHLVYPYPTDDEKHHIADMCGLSVSQVTCWFANKRNRSNHSRKHTLTDDRAAMAAKLTIYDSVKDMGPSSTVPPLPLAESHESLSLG